jgi:hypothetical protein
MGLFQHMLSCSCTECARNLPGHKPLKRGPFQGIKQVKMT